MQTKQAVCALIINKEGLILGVSRKDDPNAFGLPGGKVEHGESVLDALKREVLEETGYTIITDDLLSFTSYDGDYTVTSFKVKIDEQVPQQEVLETGVVKFVTKEELLKGPFGLYNNLLFDYFKHC